jgi:dolichyl-phosphate-mannose-protein mannosyltransferase
VPTTTRLLEGWPRVGWAVGLGVACGNAFSVKMTGLATPALVGVESALAIWFLRRPAPWRDLFTVLAAGLAVYVAYFAMHFYLLTRHGDGDSEFMSLQFQKTIKENPNYDPTAVWEGFWWTLVTINIRMVVHNANILEPHPWQSRWNEWLFNERGVSYYGKDLPFTYTAHMYLIGNHAIHWSVLFGLAGLVAMGLLYLRYRTAPLYAAGLEACRPFFAQATFCLAVYMLNMAPYFGVARSTFAYHYMPALVYGELILALVIQQLAGPKFFPLATKLFVLVIGLVWAYYTPWIYGFPLTNDGHERRRWNPRWN